MRKMTTRMLAFDAMLSAMCAALGYFSVDMGNMKITFEAFPVLAAALLFGPLHGAIVGTLGTGIFQLLKYGITVTTGLWILPYAAAGVVLGLYAVKQNFEYDRISLIVAIVLTELLITVLNTGAIYIDSVIFGYYSKAYVFGSLAVRIGLNVIKGILFGLIMPELLKAVRKLVC